MDGMQIDLFNNVMKASFEVHSLEYNDIFNATDTQYIKEKNFEPLVTKFHGALKALLGHALANHHKFSQSPSVREFNFENGKQLYIALINQQSEEWYGSENSIHSFDFINEDNLGLFNECKTFLDLGGHQLIWSIYYANTSAQARVDVYEPSILNISIGAFNCLINQVLHKINIFPYAVSKENHIDDANKMLIDYTNLPIKMKHLELDSSYDFIKVDIEGYEYELLQDNNFIKKLKGSKFCHFELHLGHLIKRNVSCENCVKLMKKHNINGVELYSKTDIYNYLSTSSQDGFYGFILSN